MTTGKSIALTRRTFVCKVITLFYTDLSCLPGCGGLGVGAEIP